MKLKKHLILFSILLINIMNSQHLKCGTKLSQKDRENFFFHMAKIKNLNANKTTGPNAKADPFVIPIVFHMLTYGINDGLNATPLTKEIMKCRIEDAIKVMNDDFNGISTPNSIIDPRFVGIRSYLPVKFELAKTDPNGQLLEIPGLNWTPEIDISFGYENKLENSDKLRWWGKNGKYYAEVFIVNYPNEDDGTFNQSGHSWLPETNHLPDVVYNHRYIGRTCGSGSDDQFAKVITHEFGHFFGLDHTFNGECDSPGDGIDDTPPTKGEDGCTRNKLNSCGVYPNFENLMDYNDCHATFTKGQVNAMTYWLNDGTAAPYPRKPLWQKTNLEATGVNSIKPTARFKTNSSSICSGKSVNFFDSSIGNPTSRSWTFTGGTPATSTDANPTVVYSTPGLYTVSLTVTNALGNDTTTKTNIIRVNNGLTTDINEKFNGIFPPEGWGIQNSDKNVTFVKGVEGGNGDLNSMLIDNYFYKSVGSIDYISLPIVNLAAGAMNSKLIFDLNYVKENNDSVDELAVEVSSDCGVTWKSVYKKSKDQLQTFTGTTLGENRQFRPTKSEHWRKETVDLNSFVGQANVIIRFKNTTGFGHRTWIDNVQVIRGGSLSNDNFNDITKSSFYITPVPAKEIVNFIVNGYDNSDTLIEIFDLSGRQVGKLINTLEYNVTNLSKGIYVAKLRSAEINESKTFIVE